MSYTDQAAAATPLDRARIEGRRSINEVARAIGKDPSTVWRWVLSGVRGKKLTSIRVGRSIYIRDEELNEFLASIQRTTTITPPPSATDKREWNRKRRTEVRAKLEAMGLY